MCGRFTLHAPIDQIRARFNLVELPFDYEPSYNIAPTQRVFTIGATKAGPRPGLMHWGLIPSWQRDKSGFFIINARLETLAEKVSFRKLVDARRCLILADGFYEWKKAGAQKTPFYITLKNKEPFAFAGLWDQGVNPQGEQVISCTIITQKAQGAIRPLHHRMPVILTPKQEDLWLSATPFSAIQPSLQRAEPLPLSFYAVDTFVNSAKNNSPRCIQPLT